MAFGVYGSLSGSTNGAGVIGSVNIDRRSLANLIDDRYAGYFYGSTLVNGTLTATEYITPLEEEEMVENTLSLNREGESAPYLCHEQE